MTTTRMFRKLIAIPLDDYARLLAYTQDIRRRSPGVKFSMNDAIRVMIHHGLDEYLGKTTKEGER